jgi:hypothetical protein
MLVSFSGSFPGMFMIWFAMERKEGKFALWEQIV